MGYLVSAGGGLLLGMGFLIWALRLKSELARAEKRAIEADLARRAAVDIADLNASKALESEAAARRASGQLDLLRDRLKEAQQRLALGGSPAAIKDWLGSELKDTKV